MHGRQSCNTLSGVFVSQTVLQLVRDVKSQQALPTDEGSGTRKCSLLAALMMLDGSSQMNPGLPPSHRLPWLITFAVPSTIVYTQL